MAEFSQAIGNVFNRTALLYKIGRQRIGFLQLDATVNENHKRSAQITKNEIEDGGTISDNYVLQNESFSIGGIISEAPLPSNDVRDIALEVQRVGFNALQNAVGALSGGIVQNAGPILKRIAALIQLENFMKNKVPFVVITGIKQYENVLIRKLEIPVNYKDGQSLRFNVDCEVVRIVKSQVVTVPEDVVKNQGAVNEEPLGKQGTKEANEDQSGEGSILYQVFN